MRFTDRVLSLHPAIVTTIFVLAFIVGGLAINLYPLGSAEWPWAFAVTMPAMLGPLILWHYSLYRAASDRNEVCVGHSGRHTRSRVLTCAGLVVFLIVFLALQTPSVRLQTLAPAAPLAMVIGNVSYFASIWAAANALTRFDDRVKSAEFHKTLGTFILEFYLPIGIWVIYPRVKRLLAAPVLG